jgi:hypothetical protein
MDTRLSDGKSDQGCDDLFIIVEDESQAVRGGCPVKVAQIQYFSFCSRGEVTGQSVTGR